MSDLKTLLQQRNKAKKVQPEFVVKASRFSARVKKRWRNPRGIHSPIRQKYKGKPDLVSIGYGSPRLVRGLHSSGLRRVVVHTENDLHRINPLSEGAVIAAGVGKKRKLQLLAVAQGRGIRLLNVRDITKTITQIKDAFAQRVALRQQKRSQKSKKEEEKKKKAQEEEKKKKTVTPVTAEKSEKNDAGVEEKVKEEQERQKELVDKTLVKRQ